MQNTAPERESLEADYFCFLNATHLHIMACNFIVNPVIQVCLPRSALSLDMLRIVYKFRGFTKLRLPIVLGSRPYSKSDFTNGIAATQAHPIASESSGPPTPKEPGS